MRRIILFLQLLLGVEMIYAQTETEILNYSRLSYAGSARAAAMGGAFGAISADDHFRVIQEIAVDGVPIFRLPQMHPIRFYIYCPVTFL